jgi:ATP-dependent DNA helicase RecG
LCGDRVADSYDLDCLVSLTLDTPVVKLKGVGPRIGEHLSRLGLQTVRDLVFHLPIRYEDRTRIVPFAECKVGGHVLIEGEIVKTWQVFAKRRSLLCQVSDGRRKITLRFFYFNAEQKLQLMALGSTLRSFGEIRLGRLGLEMIHPKYQVLDPLHPVPLENTLTPIYPATEGLRQNSIKKLVMQALAVLMDADLDDFVCEMQLDDFMPLKKAVMVMHQPSSELSIAALKLELEQARSRCALGELLGYHLRLKQLREEVKLQRGFSCEKKQDLQAAFLDVLPFDLTGAQQRVIGEITADLCSNNPMLRLLQGDVGSGKTAVAMSALHLAVKNNYQAVFMAPTEILAEQHLRQCEQYLQPLGVRIGWLAGSMTPKEHALMCADIVAGKIDLVVGTHALFQDKVSYLNLGLVVVDEQHRFGVHQRLSLQMKGQREGKLPHQLVMTATPIPRTLAMTAYADLDYSVIDELPPGRVPIKTTLLSQPQRAALMARLKQYCDKGAQAYWVCTLVETSDVLQCEAAEDVLQELQTHLPDLKIGLVHGRLKADAKQQVMAAFKAGALDVLVATTVIEVGVDVQNATVMIIDSAERLGLAQLHQLRGRVGRGSAASFCVLLHAQKISEEAERRLSIMRQTTDGFRVAEEDMRIRGPGEILGKRQAGLMLFRIADLLRDEMLVEQAKTLAVDVFKNEKLTRSLIRRWQFQSRAELLSG